jgi:hypothetical protein
MWSAVRALAVVAIVGVASASLRPARAVFAGQMATADRVQESGWWPTQPSTRRGDYVGAGVCARCHATHAAM